MLPAQLGGAAGTLAALGDDALEVLRLFADELGLAEAGLTEILTNPLYAGRAIRHKGKPDQEEKPASFAAPIDPSLFERVQAIRASGRVRWDGQAGVLAKCPKPQQDLRVDMPAIGLKTLEAAVSAGLAGIAIAATKVMILDRAEMIERADATGFFVVGIEESPA